ncbi:N-acetyltransferase GCN5 [Pontibacillus halophilus JSM 076056 = DSM 19796]|uniref:N-acetyltransferase GCN5 n=1 Tax=Pontibacillus halophilus JSM 076056 = DSM 19796 TaxID=1385510 RepID=A0A0A5HSQ8_9BACI|nr:GNAT family N-acetyltransferase [Pontibacillus halophilus]KGX86682.1 N-acetyltransferase GCN5 [Pontibacillus halophilus JSM 076056 = DSM 19796]
MEIVATSEISKSKVNHFFEVQWGTTEMVISSGIYDCSQLNGYAVFDSNNAIIGLITYIIIKDECEIISLDSMEENKGIGTSLLQAVERTALENECKCINLITTNDNLLALKFYQKRGYELAQLLRYAVDEARRLKPEIPLEGNDGIPIRDEIKLEKVLY